MPQPAAYTDDNMKIVIARPTSAVSGSRIATNGFTSTPSGDRHHQTPSSYGRLIDVDHVTAIEGTRTSTRGARQFQPAQGYGGADCGGVGEIDIRSVYSPSWKILQIHRSI
jgi:hypothetical protein